MTRQKPGSYSYSAIFCRHGREQSRDKGIQMYDIRSFILSTNYEASCPSLQGTISINFLPLNSAV